MTKRVAIYVDGANVYFAQKEALGWWIDWPRFLDAMREGNDLVSARWYQAYRSNPEPEQERFLHHLTLVGFAVRKKILKSIYDRNTGDTTLKGNLDIDLTIDALTESDHYDTAILVTGDSDFVPLVEVLRARGKRVVVAATQQNVAVELRQSVGMNYLDLRDLREKVESDKRPPERRADADHDMAHVHHDAQDAYEDDDMAIPTVRYNGFEDDDDPPPPAAPRPGDIELPQEGEIVRCRVQAVKKYGAFLDLHEHAKTLLHVKDMNRGFVPDAAEYYNVGDEVTVQIVGIDRGRETPEVRVQIAEDV
jgi:uncharacterized LabA/DUF88 family protein